MNNKENNKELSHFTKYRWVYLWIVAVAAIVFGLLMLFIKEFGQSVIYVITGFAILLFVIIRFIPLIKTISNKWALVINITELLLDLFVSVITLIFVFKGDVNEMVGFYPFLLGGVLYVRGFVYLLEVVFFKTEPKTSKFFIHLLLLTVGTVIIARFDSYTIEALRWLFGLAFTIGGVAATIDGANSFGKYRKLYQTNKKIKEDKKEQEKGIDLPSTEKDKEIDDKKDIPVIPHNDEDDRPSIVA